MNPIIALGESGAGAVSENVLSNIFSVSTELVNYAIQVLDIVVENPVLVIPIAASFLGLILAFISALRHSWS